MVLNLTGGYFDNSQNFYNPKGDTMNFLPISPPSSSVDSMDMSLTSPGSSHMSPQQIMSYGVMPQILGEQAGLDQAMPYIKILEQPVEKFRFRYKSEMSGTHGSLTGINSDRMRKCTFPTVQLINYPGPAIIRCLLVQHNSDAPHPHRLVVRVDNKDKEKDDPHDIEVSDESSHVAVFTGMGIIHTAKKNLFTELYNKKRLYFVESLVRQGQMRAPTKTEEVELKNQADREAKNVNLNTVRLCFQAFTIDNGRMIPLCPPVYSHGINNLKSALTGELKIVRIDHTTTSCVGGQEIYVLVEKVVKNNIKIRFFELNEDDKEVWSDYANFSHFDVHHQYAIVFKAPPYRNANIDEPVNVFIELYRPSDGARSEPRQFKYKPAERLGQKRLRRTESYSSSEIPATVNNYSSGASSSSLSNVLDKTFLGKIENVNSEEFNDLCTNMLPGYETLLSFDDFNLLSNVIGENGANTTDGPSKEMCKIDPLERFNAETIYLAKRVVKELGIIIKDKKDPDFVEKRVENFFRELKTSEGNNALHTAIMCEQNEELQYILVLLSKMKHLKILDLVNRYGDTALHIAVNINCLHKLKIIVTLLLEVGANPTVCNKYGNTALHCAIELGRLEVCEKLITKETINIENDDGYTPLHLAIKKHNLSYVMKLVENDAKVNYKRRSTGDTSLHIAVQEQCKDIVCYLINKTEARIDEDNFKNQTPLQQAKILAQSSSDVDSKEIYQAMKEYIKDKGYFGLDIKSEPEDEDSSDEEDINIKSEPTSPCHTPLSPEHMEVSPSPAVFMPLSQKSIDNISEVLDGTVACEQLSAAIGFPFHGKMHVTSKMLLNFVNLTQISLIRVRDLLRAYNATQAAQMMDEIIIAHKNTGINIL